jgi:hypothetical protein
MSFLTNVIPLSMTSNKYGVAVVKNLSHLAAELSAVAEEVSLRAADGTANALFGANDVIIDSEEILVGSGNAITRAQNGTSGAIHKSGAMVRLKDGQTIATLTFTGAEAITGIWVSGNAPGSYQLKFDSDYGPMKFTGAMGQEIFLPFSGITPEAGQEITVLAWTNQASMNAWAYVTR